MSEPTEAAVREEVRAWLEANWDPNLGLIEWRGRLVDSGWGVASWPKEWLGRGLPPVPVRGPGPGHRPAQRVHHQQARTGQGPERRLDIGVHVGLETLLTQQAGQAAGGGREVVGQAPRQDYRAHQALRVPRRTALVGPPRRAARVLPGPDGPALSYRSIVAMFITTPEGGLCPPPGAKASAPERLRERNR